MVAVVNIEYNEIYKISLYNLHNAYSVDFVYP